MAVHAGADVFTEDYAKIPFLPKLTGNPGDVDWRAKGAVTPVKNEGDCDSSWAFAVTGLVEGYSTIHGGILRNLSEQQLLDCTGSGSSCNGGSPVSALERLVESGGIAATNTYPYTAREGTCKSVAPVATIPGVGRVPDETSLANYVAQGPVLALVDDSGAFALYKSGIFNGPCGRRPTRAVLIVGYTSDHWTVKNSLGASWGAQGYIFIARGKNLCGIADHALAVSNDPLPPPQPLPPPLPPPPPTGDALAIPTLGAWTLGLLGIAVALFGLLRLRRRSD